MIPRVIECRVGFWLHDVVAWLVTADVRNIVPLHAVDIEMCAVSLRCLKTLRVLLFYSTARVKFLLFVLNNALKVNLCDLLLLL